MAMQRPHSHYQSMHTMKTLVAQALHVSPDQVVIKERPRLPIQNNCLYDVYVAGRHLIAKEFLRFAVEPLAPVREFQSLQRLGSLGIAPQPLLYRPDVAPVVVYEFMDGVMWDRSRPQPAQLSQLADLWTILAQMQTSGLVDANSDWRVPRIQEAFVTYAQWTATQFPPGQQAAALCLRLLEPLTQVVQALLARPPQLGFCRLDARFANIIQRSDGRLGLVDWEDSGLGDPAFALADMMLHVNQEDLVTWETWHEVFEPYLQMMQEKDAGFRGRVHHFHYLLSVFWLALFIPHGIQRSQDGTVSDWRINDVPANLRLRRYLARALAWPDMEFQNQLNDLENVVFFS